MARPRGVDMNASSRRQAVSEYYNATWLTSRVSWFNPDTLALHLGYWNERTRSHADSLREMTRAMAERVALSSGQEVLDAGCGLGGAAMLLAKEYGARVLGITIVGEQVAKARAAVASRGLQDRVRIEERDFLHTGLPDASVDVVFAQESVCHTEQKQGFLAEAFRVLRPGGKLVMEDVFRFDRPYSAEEDRLLATWLEGVCCPDIPSSGSFLAWAREAGFCEARIEDITRNVAPSCRRLEIMLRASTPIARIMAGLRLVTKIQYANLRGLLAQQQALAMGAWFSGFVIAQKPGHTPDRPQS